MKKEKIETLRRNIPKEMQDLPNWCVFKTRWNEEKGKKDKFIISPKTGKWAKANMADTWTDFETALRYVASDNAYVGIAFALNKNGIACIDLDHSIDENGQLTPLAKRLSELYSDTYTETSVSGNGIHIFVQADLLDGDKYQNRSQTPDGEIEIYDNARFISMTGETRNQVKTLSNGQSANNSLRAYLTVRPKLTTQKRSYGLHATSNEIIERIRKSKVAGEFNSLYAGESLTNDHSRDDYKLLCMLSFFCNGDERMIRDIFETSGLYRPEKGEKYLDISIKKAIEYSSARRTTTYHNIGRKGKKKEEKSSQIEKGENEQ